ncbi:MAG: hypothetical protein WC624_00575 [Candidatus Margulisiibacteriota bacterium]
MKNLAKTLIWIGAIALVIGIVSSLSFTMGNGMTFVVKAINWYRGAIALLVLAAAILLSEK